MTDSITVPIILSVVSLAATIITTLVGAYITYFSEEHKARREANKILLKYRDPLLLAAVDLQARCWGICDHDILDFKHRDVPGDDTYKDTLYIYTAYVVGQYLSWAWILRRQAQFMALVSSSTPQWQLFHKKTKQSSSNLMKAMEAVKAALNNDTHKGEGAFRMFKAHQQIIGEIMSCQDATSSEYYCMGFATFTARWKSGHPENVDKDGKHNAGTVSSDDKDHAGERMAGVTKISDQAFRAHFKVIEDGIDHMYQERMDYKELHPNEKEWNNRSDGRLRRLQHLLLDLMDHLDSTGKMINDKESSPAHAAPGCQCSLSPCHCNRGCLLCIRKGGNSRFAPAKSVSHCACEDCVKPEHRRLTQSWQEAMKSAAEEKHTEKVDAVAGAESVASSHDRNAAHA